MRIFNHKKRNITVLTVFLTAALVLVFAGKALGTWGPSRPTYTWAHPADHITFNSITDNPSVGDERVFATGRVLPSNTNIDPVTGVKDGDHVKVQVYFHNNAASNLNKKAKNTRVSIALRDPNTANVSHFLSTQISADNATPQAVWDTVDIKGDQPFTLSYVPGSARLFNGVFTTASGGIALPDDVTSEAGTLVGFDKMDGIVPGCSEFSGFVYIEVVVHAKPSVTPQFACNLLSLDVVDSKARKVNASVTYTASGGATFKNATFNWGDNSTPTIVSATSASHTYSADGTYTVNATLKFDVGDTEQQASCSKSITFTTPPPTTPPPSTPPATTLPNTGPGSVAAIFGGVTAFAGMFHYLWRGRKQTDEIDL